MEFIYFESIYAFSFYWYNRNVFIFQLNKSVHGEEMPYVLGIPLGGANTHFHSEYTLQEKLLSEVIMRLWTNFVKNGYVLQLSSLYTWKYKFVLIF